MPTYRVTHRVYSKGRKTLSPSKVRTMTVTARNKTHAETKASNRLFAQGYHIRRTTKVQRLPAKKRR